ncbi:hypothetical protein GCM10027346_17610 [Hymenobacter seoulensis]
MYLKKLTIENIRGLKHLEMTFPVQPAGWHVIIGDNGAGKSTLIRAIALGLIGPNEVRAAHPNFAEWLRKDAKSGFVELSLGWDSHYDSSRGLGKAQSLKAKVLLQPSNSFSGIAGSAPIIEAIIDEHVVKPALAKHLWGNSTKGWFSAGFGPFRRFTGGDTEHDKVYLSSPRCGAHLSVFGEDVALTEALRWLQEIDYQQLKAREKKIRQDTQPLNLAVNKSIQADSVEEVIEKVEQLWDIAARLRKNSLYKEAESLLHRALNIAENEIEHNRSLISLGLNHLASLFMETNRTSKAEPLIRRALAIDEANHGSDSAGVAISLINLANLLQETNRLEEAEPLLRRALALDEANYGPNHPDILVSLSNLGTLLKKVNKLSEAELLMRRALALAEAHHSNDNNSLTVCLNNLALLLRDTNRLEEAEVLMRRALAIDEVSYGPDHPTIGLRLSNLAILLQDANRLEEAEPLMRRSLAIGEANYGPDHPRVATRLNNLALLLKDTKRLDEAEVLIRRALAIDEASYGPDHHEVATDLNNLAALLQETKRLEEAEPLIRRALAIDEASYGPDHPGVATDLNNLAALLQETNRLEEAEPLVRRALAIDEASYGPDHPTIGLRLSNLAILLQDANRLEEAEPLIRRALAIDEANYGPGHPRVIARLNDLALLLKDTNRLEEASTLVQQYKAKNAASTAPIIAINATSVSQKLPLEDNDWLAIRLRTFINESKLLPAGTEFKGMSTEGPIFQDGNGQKVSVTQLSDGFRSILSLSFELIRQLIRVYGLAAVFPPSRTHTIIELPGVVLIDEIDTHLHPTWQTRIGQWFTKCFPQLQFIVTTHSPLICRAVTDTAGSIWRLPTPGQGQNAEEVTGVERQRLRLGSVLDAYGTGLFGGHEVEQAQEATALLNERARLSAKESVGKATPSDLKRLIELRQIFSSVDATVEY